jgi:hypothetical protein
LSASSALALQALSETGEEECDGFLIGVGEAVDKTADRRRVEYVAEGIYKAGDFDEVSAFMVAIMFRQTMLSI